MIALAVVISVVAIFWLGKVSGRIEAYNAMINYLASMRRELPIEDKLMFDKWFNDYNSKYYPNSPKVGGE